MVFNPDQKLTADPKPEDAATAADILESLRAEFKVKYDNPSKVPPDKVKYALKQVDKLAKIYEADEDAPARPDAQFEGLRGNAKEVFMLNDNKGVIALDDRGNIYFWPPKQKEPIVLETRSQEAGEVTSMNYTYSGKIILGYKKGYIVSCRNIETAMIGGDEHSMSVKLSDTLGRPINSEITCLSTGNMGGKVYVGNENGYVHFVNMETGADLGIVGVVTDKRCYHIVEVSGDSVNNVEILIADWNSVCIDGPKVLRESRNIHSNRVKGLFLFPNAQSEKDFVSVDEDGVLRKNNFDRNKLSVTLTGHEGKVSAAAFWEKEYLFLGTPNGYIRCYKLKLDEFGNIKYDVIGDFKAHKHTVNKLQFVYRGMRRKLLSAGGDGLVKEWDFQEILKIVR